MSLKDFQCGCGMKSPESQIYEMLVDYGLNEKWFSMYHQGTFTDDAGDLHRIDAVFNNGFEDSQFHQTHLLLVRLAEMIA